MNAVQRFIRSRVLLLTASILIVAMCLSVLVQGQSQAALNRTVDQNSRGLYDVLVQAKAERQRRRSCSRKSPPARAASASTSWTPIRKLSGTSVAAPISLVSRVTQNLESPRLDATDYLGFNAGLAGTVRGPDRHRPEQVAGRRVGPERHAQEVPPHRQRRQLRRHVRADPVQDHGRRLPRQGQAHRRAGRRRQERPHRRARTGETGIKFPAPAGGSEHNLFNLSVSLPHGAAGDRVRRRRRPRLRTRPARRGRRLPGPAGEGPAGGRPQRRRDRPALREPLHQRHQHGPARRKAPTSSASSSSTGHR